jgi:Protein of unknown function (DUF1566)
MRLVVYVAVLCLGTSPFAFSQTSAPRRTETAREPAAADASLTWIDSATGLMWTKRDNGSDLNWNQALSYCSNLQLGGYSGWRLPTIEELQGIYDPSAGVRAVFGNGFTLNVHVMGNLKLTGWHWSSSQGEAPGQPWVAWTFNFGGETPRGTFPLGFSYSMRALCVRPSGQ